MVHHSKARTQALTQFIMENVIGHRTAFEIGDVKQDGTVFVRFRSWLEHPAMNLARDFGLALGTHGKLWIQTDDRTIRLALDQF